MRDLELENFKKSEKEIRKKIKHEIEVNKRETFKKDYKTKIYNIKTFTNVEDDKLLENKELHNNILNHLKICVNPDCKESRCNNIIILYTNLKVGSTSLWSSFNLYLSELYTTVHWHNEVYLEKGELYSISIKKLIELLKYYKKNVFVIDIYRPILDICISNYFNEANVNFQRDFNLDNDFDKKEIFINRFNKLFNYYYNKLNVDYFKEIYNLPYNFEKFDFNKKYLLYEDETIRYIKLRLCDFDELHKILTPLLNKDNEIENEIKNKLLMNYDNNETSENMNIKYIKYNETKDKGWGNYYEYFKENYLISPEIFELIKNNEYFLFYYTQEEQNSYLKKYSNKISNSTIMESYNEDELKFYFKILNENEAGFNYGYLSTHSNKPLITNCICKECNNNRNKLKVEYEKNGVISIKQSQQSQQAEQNQLQKENINKEKIKRELLNRIIRKQMLTGKRNNTLGKLNFVSNL